MSWGPRLTAVGARCSNRIMSNHPARLVLISLALPLLAAPALAKRNEPNVYLTFRPQQSVATVAVSVSDAMTKRPVEIRLKDSRPGNEPAAIGSRTDDEDHKFTLRAVNEVIPFVKQVLADTARQWGVHDEEGADLVLDATLQVYEALETNQAVGATFNAQVRLAAELKDRAGKVLWSGSSPGDATRYGKKFSNENVNEVLSDALLESFAGLLSEPGLQDAWAGRK